MKQIALFEKVSFEQFKKDIIKCFGETYDDNNIEIIYNEIKLPTRATTGSAGYDFKIPFDIIMHKGHECLIPTGIRANIENGWVLQLFPRSGLGFKRGLTLLNTVGIIDSDYYSSNNEGHIMVMLTHKIGDYILKLQQGDSFIQGVFVPFGITKNDNVNKIRNGGFGSTGR